MKVFICLPAKLREKHPIAIIGEMNCSIPNGIDYWDFVIRKPVSTKWNTTPEPIRNTVSLSARWIVVDQNRLDNIERAFDATDVPREVLMKIREFVMYE